MTQVDDDRIARLERLVAEQAQAIEAQRHEIDQLVAERRTPAAAGPTQVRRDPNRRAPDDADGVSRRNVLRRALVAGGAVVAGSAALAMADAAPAAAATGNPILAGDQTNAESTTVLYADAAPASYSYGIAAVSDTAFTDLIHTSFVPGALTGISTLGNQIGVSGYGAYQGVYAASSTGTALVADGHAGIEAIGRGSLALHASTDPTSNSTAARIEAYGTGNALELSAEPRGAALQVTGTTVLFGRSAFAGLTYFTRSGSVRVRGTKRHPSRSAAVTGIALTRTSKVIATIQGDGGNVGVAGVTVNVAKKTFTITLTAKVPRYVTVAWLIIE